jgi:hypothetical protein
MSSNDFVLEIYPEFLPMDLVFLYREHLSLKLVKIRKI